MQINPSPDQIQEAVNQATNSSPLYETAKEITLAILGGISVWKMAIFKHTRKNKSDVQADPYQNRLSDLKTAMASLRQDFDSHIIEAKLHISKIQELTYTLSYMTKTRDEDKKLLMDTINKNHIDLLSSIDHMADSIIDRFKDRINSIETRLNNHNS